MEATKAALKVITYETEATPDEATSGHSNCTVMEAVENIEGQVKASVCVVYCLIFFFPGNETGSKHSIF